MNKVLLNSSDRVYLNSCRGIVEAAATAIVIEVFLEEYGDALNRRENDAIVVRLPSPATRIGEVKRRVPPPPST